jgi:hypothetical protein
MRKNNKICKQESKIRTKIQSKLYMILLKIIKFDTDKLLHESVWENCDGYDKAQKEILLCRNTCIRNFLLPQTFKLFVFPICWLWVYLMQIITETCRSH